MNNEQVTSTRSQLCNALQQRFVYQQTRSSTALSKAIGENFQTIEGILATEDFVELVLSNNEPAWDMPKTLTRYLPPRLTPIGGRFYEKIQNPMCFLDEAWYEIGMHSQLFCRVAKEMELDSKLLSRAPLHQQNDQAPREGEYLNGFVERIRKLGREQKFQDARKEREKTAKCQQREAKKLLSSLSFRVTALFGQWITLEYQHSVPFPQMPNQLESDAHLNFFRDGLQDMASKIQSVGQIWMRHYLPETGFRIRMLLLHTSKVVEPRQDWAEPLNKLWMSATEGRGSFTIEPFLVGVNEIESALKIHALSETIIRSVSGSSENFGCFDSYSMAYFGLPAPQPLGGDTSQMAISRQP